MPSSCAGHASQRFSWNLPIVQSEVGVSLWWGEVLCFVIQLMILLVFIFSSLCKGVLVFVLKKLYQGALHLLRAFTFKSITTCRK